MNEVRIATRPSALALVQARRVAEMLQAANSQLSVRLVEVATSG
ncbi:MAG: hydroxymethylbilane synthase, partial [bacterium]